MIPVEIARVERCGLTLYAERFAGGVSAVPPGGPAVLLLSAAEAPSSRWPDTLIEFLVEHVGQVVRFDTRDSGRSSAAETGYTLDDLALDAVAVADHFGLDRFHVIGRSMGGMVAQLLALDHPERVATIGLLSSSAGPAEEHGGPAQWFVDRMSARLFGDPPESRAERIEWIVEQQEWFAGSRYPFDRDDVTRRAAAEVDSFWHDTVGHGVAVVESPPRHDRLGSIRCPALVVHGTADPVYPVAHGQALAAGIADARLHLVEELGHELPDAFVDTLIPWLQEFY